jgi:hypothetical protein
MMAAAFWGCHLVAPIRWERWAKTKKAAQRWLKREATFYAGFKGISRSAGVDRTPESRLVAQLF